MLAALAFALLGGILSVAPWTALWKDAAQVWLSPPARAVALTGWVRGAVSGIGLLDLVVAAQLAREVRGRSGPRVG